MQFAYFFSSNLLQTDVKKNVKNANEFGGYKTDDVQKETLPVTKREKRWL